MYILTELLLIPWTLGISVKFAAAATNVKFGAAATVAC